MTEKEKIGIGGHIKNYDILIRDDAVTVTDQSNEITREKVDGLGEFIEAATEFRIGWARTADFEIIYLYDKSDDNFGYAVNLADPWMSEWGYAPFQSN